MRQYTEFIYDGVDISQQFNGVQISDDAGLFSEHFVATKRINEEKIRGKDEPYHFGVEREPISFPLSFWFEEEWSDEKKRDFARLIDQNFYKPLYAKDNPNRIYYAMTTDDSQHIHNGIDMGYFTLMFRCNSPYAYSPVYEETFDLKNNTEDGTDLTFVNNGDIECKPIITIEMAESGDFSIVNTSDGGREFKFTGLANSEKVVVDCNSEEITSDLITHRYDNFNDNYLSFLRGNNYLKVYGKATITLKYQFKIK